MASQNEAELVDELTEDNICSICTNLLLNNADWLLCMDSSRALPN